MERHARPNLDHDSLSALTANQVRGFWAAWGGWALDGMDSFIYALVLAPAMTELLPRSGIAATPASLGFYGGLLFALFLIGWGLSMLWGPVADRYGRVRTLSLTILCYSLFTFLGAFTTNVWQLAACRLLAGIGIGGEWSMGGTFLAEEWPEDRRATGAGYMHTGYYVGIFLAGLLNYTLGARFGWRAMFLVGGVPALFVTFIRRSVRESRRWEEASRADLDDRRVREVVLRHLPAQDLAQCHLPARLHRRLVGRLGLRASSVAYLAAGAGYAFRRRDAARVLRHDVVVAGHHCRLPGPSSIGRCARSPAHAGGVTSS